MLCFLTAQDNEAHVIVKPGGMKLLINVKYI